MRRVLLLAVVSLAALAVAITVAHSGARARAAMVHQAALVPRPGVPPGAVPSGPTTCEVASSSCSLTPCVAFVSPSRAQPVAPAPVTAGPGFKLSPATAGPGFKLSPVPTPQIPRVQTFQTPRAQCLPSRPRTEPVGAVAITGTIASPVAVQQYRAPASTR